MASTYFYGFLFASPHPWPPHLFLFIINKNQQEKYGKKLYRRGCEKKRYLHTKNTSHKARNMLR
jgi:hypothetical protein